MKNFLDGTEPSPLGDALLMLVLFDLPVMIAVAYSVAAGIL